ncbi:MULTISPECIES: GNAT family N-acetyltransferase [unclassified Pseudomonas]|uniref:GNAT family N-acetyltransferase n=1 Tax=unclassified Pseudomonas TaxID=196821 RepID=UPI00244B571B|nr:MULTISPECIES: GNAT family N-acetyltransferase [unclassified Pseudomonas]MDG9922697.1 GNAT family N-acetyltransferase [Pseudomonas sp. GD04045]MDH0033170.1 GNAT family N-acetyltransferase [Pseudomonas sp. GD04019]
MEVRRICQQDLDAFYALFGEVNAEGKYSARATPPPKDAVRHALKTAEENNWPIYVAEEGNNVIASAEAYPESFCREGGDAQVAILGMQVKQDYRRRGYGEALLSAVIRHCKNLDFTSIDLSVLKSNEAARNLYKKAGFAWVEDLPVCTRPDGREDQPEKMRLVL